MFGFLNFFKKLASIPDVSKINSCVCSVCKHKYSTPDAAALCSDWDMILGTNRHKNDFES